MYRCKHSPFNKLCKLAWTRYLMCMNFINAQSSLSNSTSVDTDFFISTITFYFKNYSGLLKITSTNSNLRHFFASILALSNFFYQLISFLFPPISFLLLKKTWKITLILDYSIHKSSWFSIQHFSTFFLHSVQSSSFSAHTWIKTAFDK